jgi:chromosome segregation ATPase
MARLLRVLTFIAIAAAMPAAHAADPGGADPRALAKMQYMLKQTSAERDALQAEVAALKAELDALNKKHAALRVSAEGALAKSKENNVALNDKLQETAARLQQTETEKRELEGIRTEQAQQIEACTDKNAKLFKANMELLGHYEKKGWLDALMQKEPLTGLKQVEIENLAEEYRDRIEALQVRSKAPAATAN